MFETTIRYLASSLSAYELSGKKFPVLIEKAKEVADKMSVAWVGVNITYSPSHVACSYPTAAQNNAIPFGEIDFNTSTPQVATVRLSPLTFRAKALNAHTPSSRTLLKPER